MLFLPIFILSASLVVEFLFARKIPDYIHICKRTDPNVSKCIRESVDFLRPRLKKGLPEINVPPIEPFTINEIAVFQGEPPTHFKVIFRNIKVHGVSDFKISKLKLDVSKNTYRLGFGFDFLSFDGEYEVDAKILIVPIQGIGNFYANITGVSALGDIKSVIFNNPKGFRQLNFTNFDFNFKIKDYSIRLDNLFEGDKVLGQAATEVLHANKQEFINTAVPIIQRETSKLLLRVANAITDNLDYDKVFPA